MAASTNAPAFVDAVGSFISDQMNGDETPSHRKCSLRVIIKGMGMNKASFLGAATSLLLSVAAAAPASAAPLLYSFAPTSAGAQRFTFNIDSNPVPSQTTPFQFTAVVQNFTLGGVTQTGTNSFTFYGSFGDGGLFNSLAGSFAGPPLYDGLTSAPSLAQGSFVLTGGPGGAGGTLTVSVVPEPEAWAMMVVGFGLAGVAMRRRKTAMRVSYAASRA